MSSSTSTTWCAAQTRAWARLPIHIGGHSAAAARRAGRCGDGFQPLGVTGADLERLLAVMRAEAIRTARDPDGIEVSLGHAVTRIDAERAAKLQSQGADRIVLAMPAVTDIHAARDALSDCAQRLGLTG